MSVKLDNPVLRWLLSSARIALCAFRGNMSKTTNTPKLLYKYRAFSPRLLDMLVADELYYSDPSDFNDPLDCRPTLDANLPNDQLEHVLSHLREQRILFEKISNAYQSDTYQIYIETYPFFE